MSPDAGTPPFQEWHAALRDRDTAVHSAQDERTRREAVEVLELRTVAMNAELRALVGAIRLRDQLLNEQRVALAERHELIPGPTRDLLREARIRPLREAARRVRRVAGRAVRRVLP